MKTERNRTSSEIEVNSINIDKTEADIKNKYFDLFECLGTDQVLQKNYFDEKKSRVQSNCRANLQVSIIVQVSISVDYWENVIGENTVVTSVTKEGSKILFTYTLQKVDFKKNKSAFQNSDFVTNSIKNILVYKLSKLSNIPYFLSPLSMPKNCAGKKWLFFDYSDLKCFKNFEYRLKMYL